MSRFTTLVKSLEDKLGITIVTNDKGHLYYKSMEEVMNEIACCWTALEAADKAEVSQMFSTCFETLPTLGEFIHEFTNLKNCVGFQFSDDDMLYTCKSKEDFVKRYGTTKQDMLDDLYVVDYHYSSELLTYTMIVGVPSTSAPATSESEE